MGKFSPCSLLGWGPTFFSFERVGPFSSYFSSYQVLGCWWCICFMTLFIFFFQFEVMLMKAGFFVLLSLALMIMTITYITFNQGLSILLLVCFVVFLVLFIIHLCLLLYLFFVCFSIPSFALQGSVHRLYTRNSDRLYTRDRIVSARGPFLPRIVCTRSAYCYAQEGTGALTAACFLAFLSYEHRKCCVPLSPVRFTSVSRSQFCSG